LKPYVKLLRPHQWLKNLFVLVPAFFAGRISLLFSDWHLAAAVAAFCLSASAVYIINDLLDLEKDRLHEIKSKRPLVTGEVSFRSAIILFGILGVAGLALALFIGRNFFYAVVAYIVLNVLYSVWLKHISLIDISMIATGFVIRVLAGGHVADVFVSKWLIMMTFLLACCLALGKRRDDLLLDVNKATIRPSLQGYTLPFVDTCLVVLAVTTVVCYIMYTVSEDVVQRMHSDRIYLTSVFVIIGILRYLQIALVEQKTGSPTLILLKDRMIETMIALWLISFLFIIYVT
jgi:decaprenyl-phosphate phosphoribosyltransferase